MGRHITVSDMEPLEAMSVLGAWPRIIIKISFSAGQYWESQSAVHKLLAEKLNGPFMVMLDREDEMTDEIAYLSIRAEELDDIAIARMLLPDA